MEGPGEVVGLGVGFHLADFMLTTVGKGTQRNHDLYGHDPYVYVTELLNLAAKEEIVHRKAYPAEQENQDTPKNLAQQTALCLFEDVNHTPYGTYNTQNVNNCFNHSDKRFELIIKIVFLAAKLLYFFDIRK